MVNTIKKTPLERAIAAIPHVHGDRSEREKIARAVLLAIREPSEAMKVATVDAAGFHGWYDDGPESRQSACEVWQAMIDVALEEG